MTTRILMKSVVRSLLALVAVAAVSLPVLGQDPTPEAEVVRLYVGPETAECVGVAPQQCLLVSTSPDGEPEFFYEEIAGFTHVPGTTYALDVLVEPVEDPPADGSSLKYTLVDVVAEIPSDGEGVATSQQTSEVVRLYIGPETADCIGVGPQKCLLVATSPDGEPGFFYDEISGYMHEPGTSAVIDVLVESVENLPADGSSLKYTLIDVVAQD
jgi:hypothetical protein